MSKENAGSIKVSELSGALLALWVARANEWKVEREDESLPDFICWDERGEPFSFGACGYRPYENWAQGGQIIERECIAIDPLTRSGRKSNHWQAQVWTPYAVETGETPLIAAMRAYVASKLGDEVELP